MSNDAPETPEATPEAVPSASTSAEASAAAESTTEAEVPPPPEPAGAPPAPTVVVKYRVSAAQLFFSCLIGMVIGFFLHAALPGGTAKQDKEILSRTVANNTAAVDEMIADAAGSFDTVIANLNDKNFGSAGTQLDKVIDKLSRAQSIAVDEAQRTKLDQLAAELATLRSKIKALDPGAADAAAKASDSFKQSRDRTK